MKHHFTHALVCASLVLALAGCHSVATPFVRLALDYSTVPEENLRALAADIEKAVWAGDRDFVLESYEGIVVETPEIKQAIRTRAARSELLQDFLGTGFGYEQQNGLVHIQRNKAYKSATSSRERDRHALLVMSENENRWALYEGIQKASKFSSRSLSAIQAVFFEARQDLLSEGMRYETPDGDIAVK